LERELIMTDLTLEVWTNAGVDPVDAVAYSAKILRDQLTLFLNFEDEDTAVEVKAPAAQTTQSNSS
jgi:DNA-directed RNA polymerase subunit alpha